MKLQSPLPMLHKLWGVSKPLLAQWCVAKRFDERVEANAIIVTTNWRIKIYSVRTRIEVVLQGLPSYVNKHEYIDKVVEHRLTTAIRPQINAFLEGFNELVSRELISIFNDKELELLISGLPEIDLEDYNANTEYTLYTAASLVVQWFWDVVRAFNKEDMARLLQFITGTSKVPLEGFRALQGISGRQRFQIHKAYGAPKRMPSLILGEHGVKAWCG